MSRSCLGGPLWSRPALSSNLASTNNGGGGAFSPAQLANVIFWHKPNSGVTSSGSVTSWLDLSTAHNNYAPPGGETGPVLTAAVQNGLPMVKGDELVSVLAADGAAASISGTGQSYAYFAVVKGLVIDANVQQTFIACTIPEAGGDPSTELYYDGATGQWTVEDGNNAGSTVTIGAPISDSAVHLLAVLATATTVKLYVDGVLVVSGARPGGAQTLDHFTIMAHRSGTSPTPHYQSYGGYYGEDLLLSATPNAGTLSAIFAYFLSSWAIPTPAAPTNLSDTFVGVDGTSLAAHTMNVGNGWLLASGAWTIQSNRAAKTADATNRYESTVAESGAADVTITCDLFYPASGNFGMGITARCCNDLNKWVAVVDSDGHLYLFEYHGGTASLRAQSSWTAQHGSTQTLTVTCSGTTISASVGDASLSYNTATGSQTATRHGLALYDGSGYTANGRFDNFAVTNN